MCSPSLVADQLWQGNDVMEIVAALDATAQTRELLLDSFMQGFIHELFLSKWSRFAGTIYYALRSLDVFYLLVILYQGFALKISPQHSVQIRTALPNTTTTTPGPTPWLTLPGPCSHAPQVKILTALSILLACILSSVELAAIYALLCYVTPPRRPAAQLRHDMRRRRHRHPLHPSHLLPPIPPQVPLVVQ
jgi:hypothetical protein